MRKGGEANPGGHARHYSKVWASIPRYLAHSDVSGREYSVVIRLLEYQNGPTLWAPRKRIAEDLDLTERQVKYAIECLCKKRKIAHPDGTETPVLTLVRSGHNGHASEYRLNIPYP